MPEVIIAPKGLAGVIADDSSISKVNVELSKLIYRGYEISELCENSNFMETAYLLLNDELPNPQQARDFDDFERENREIPESVYEIFQKIPPKTHPMDCLRLGVDMIASFDEDNLIGDNAEEKILRKSKLLLSKIPTIIANAFRVVSGKSIVHPNPKLSFSQNFLSMILGEKLEDAKKIKAFDDSLILYAEHGFNASTFASRVTASTLSDYYASIISAIGTLKGPLHGGANEQVMYMLEDIKEPEKAESYIKTKLVKKEKIMGFGHRLYRTGDSRVPIMREHGALLAESAEQKKLLEIAQIVESTMKKEKNIYPNMDFPSATLYYFLDIPIGLYTPIFVASRITGWSAHVIEQHRNNRLIRPGCRYIGPEKRSVLPIGKR